MGKQLLMVPVAFLFWPAQCPNRDGNTR